VKTNNKFRNIDVFATDIKEMAMKLSANSEEMTQATNQTNPRTAVEKRNAYGGDGDGTAVRVMGGGTEVPSAP